MQWANTLTAFQWAILALIPPAIIALYFLKLKRKPLEVPSTYLWRKSIEDLHVNSLWQRMRQNLLLYLQLLLLAIVMLALLRPSLQTARLSGERLIFLIDNSASMSANDVEPSRLEEAKRKALEMVESMESGQRAMIVSFSDTARVEQTLTDNERELREAIERIPQTSRPTSLDEALRVAAGMANPGSMRDQQAAEELEATLYILSDGRFADVQGFSLGNLNPVFMPIGDTEAANVGIEAFSTRPHEDRPNQQQAFARIENAGGATVRTQLELYRDGQLADVSEIVIEAGKSAGAVFDLGEAEAGILRLRIPRPDAMMVDNEAWAVINPPQRATVLLVSPGNQELAKALGTDAARKLADVRSADPGVLETEEHQEAAANGAFDLIVYDRCVPVEMPQSNTLFLGAIPSGEWSEGSEAIGPQILDIARSHPLMQNLDLGDVEIFKAQPIQGPAGSTVLVDSTAGPLVVIGPRQGFEDVAIGFPFRTTDDSGSPIVNTTWPIRQSFPVFVLNALSYLAGAEAISAMNVQPGASVALRSSSVVDELVVERPNGESETVRRGRMNAFPFIHTDLTGVYTVEEQGALRHRFTVNLFDPTETSLATRKGELQIGYVDVEGRPGFEPARRELWKLLLLAGLVVLLLEWYIYNRRVYL